MRLARPLGVEYNRYLHRWMMLYECTNAADATASRPNGIWMRTATKPWGPLSSPQTVLNPAPSTGLGYCYLIYDSTPSSCPSDAKDPHDPTKTTQGLYYGPFFIAGWTAGQTGLVLKGSHQEQYVCSTFCYTPHTGNPYGECIMQSTVRERVG